MEIAFEEYENTVCLSSLERYDMFVAEGSLCISMGRSAYDDTFQVMLYHSNGTHGMTTMPAYLEVKVIKRLVVEM